MKYYRGYEVCLLDSASSKINHCSLQHHSVLPQMRMSIAHAISCPLELNIIQFRMCSITLLIENWHIVNYYLTPSFYLMLFCRSYELYGKCICGLWGDLLY